MSSLLSRRGLAVALVSTGVLAASGAASAAAFGSWGGTRPTMNVNPWMIFASTSYYAMQNTVNYLYNNPSQFYYTLAWDDDTTYAVGNWENETTNTTDAALLGGADGRCVWSLSGSTLVEADVYMNSSQVWEYDHVTSQAVWYGGTERPYETTFLHEMGHASGLAHVNNVYNVMGQDYTHLNAAGTTWKMQLGGANASVLRSSYGDWASSDLGMYHWRYDYANGEYSWHTRTRVQNSSGTTLSGFSNGMETVYYVPKGSSVRAEFTYDNQGTTSGSRLYGYFLSTDRTITTGDTFLTSVYRTIATGSPTTTTQTMTIPSTTATGYYYIGAMADPWGALSEIDEANNTAYNAIYVY